MKHICYNCGKKYKSRSVNTKYCCEQCFINASFYIDQENFRMNKKRNDLTNVNKFVKKRLITS